MKKLGKILLIVWAVLATVLLVLSCIAFSEVDAEWSADYKSLKTQYDSLSEDYINLQYQNADMIVFEGWAKSISEEYFVGKIDDETILVAVSAEGRTISEFADTVSNHAAVFTLSLQTSEYSKGIVVFLDDDNNVWGGINVSENGETSSFVLKD